MRAAAVQLTSTPDRDRNLATADRLTREAAAAGAELVVLPEKWPVLGTPDLYDVTVTIVSQRTRYSVATRLYRAASGEAAP